MTRSNEERIEFLRQLKGDADAIAQQALDNAVKARHELMRKEDTNSEGEAQDNFNKAFKNYQDAMVSVRSLKSDIAYFEDADSV